MKWTLQESLVWVEYVMTLEKAASGHSHLSESSNQVFTHTLSVVSEYGPKSPATHSRFRVYPIYYDLHQNCGLYRDNNPLSMLQVLNKILWFF